MLFQFSKYTLVTRFYCYIHKNMCLASGRDFEISEQCRAFQNLRRPGGLREGPGKGSAGCAERPSGRWSSGGAPGPSSEPSAQHSGAKERGLSPPLAVTDGLAGRRAKTTDSEACGSTQRPAADRPSRTSTPCAAGAPSTKGLARGPRRSRPLVRGGAGRAAPARGHAQAESRARPQGLSRRRVHPGSSHLCSPVLPARPLRRPQGCPGEGAKQHGDARRSSSFPGT